MSARPISLCEALCEPSAPIASASEASFGFFAVADGPRSSLGDRPFRHVLDRFMHVIYDIPMSLPPDRGDAHEISVEPGSRPLH